MDGMLSQEEINALLNEQRQVQVLMSSTDFLMLKKMQ